MSRLVATALALATAFGTPTPSWAAAEDPPVPRAMQGVDVIERLGDKVPQGLEFTGADGQPVRLAEALGHGRPVVLTLVYFNCPMLCGTLMGALTAGLRTTGLELGRDYELLTVSIDPRDTAAQAADKQGHYLQALGRPQDRAHWQFLVGTQAPIEQLAHGIGFEYRYDARRGQFAHPAVVFVLTPDGRISRYLYGIEFPQRDLRLAIVEASGGKVGNSFDRFLLTCYHYDPANRRYALFVSNYLRVGGLLVFLGLSTVLVTLWRRERRGSASA